MPEITKIKHPLVILRERLESRIDELRNALVDVDPHHFIRTLITSADENPLLQACSWPTLWQACLRACRDDLLPDGRQGVIVPYKDRATWIPMYQGLVLRAQRTGKIKAIRADIVREGELWEYWVDGEGVHFSHHPGDDISRPMLRVYAAAWMKGGGFYLAVMPKAEADKIRAMSKTVREDSPWRLWESEMYKKTALRRLAKLLPIELPLPEEPEELEAEAPRPTPAMRAPRPGSPAARLQAFAGELDLAANAMAEEKRTSELLKAPGIGASEGRGEAEAEAEAAAAAGDPAEAEAAAEKHRALREAYKRGQDDKSRGVPRRACPPELRDVPLLALSWVRGWAGDPFVNEEQDR